jgi:glycerol kinase
VPNCDGVYFVPAFTGLGSPHWDMYARGCIVGITRSTKREHIIRAALESIAFQSYDLISAIENDTGITITELRADGGASVNNLLMQFQADISGKAVCRPSESESTALGAAFLAGLSVGVWSSTDELKALWRKEATFFPQMSESDRAALLRGWERAIGRSLGWAERQSFLVIEN